ncbi:MAG: hypothetical protein ACYCUI_17295 [Vulcanimicrobiaceae bacterium]
MSKKSAQKIEALCLELGHPGDVTGALKHAVAMRSALRVIHTWCCIPGALDGVHVIRIANSALHRDPSSAQ